MRPQRTLALAKRLVLPVAGGIAALTLGILTSQHAPVVSAASTYNENVGGGANGVSVETFRPALIFVNEGDTVKFTNNYAEVHTVTFPTKDPIPDLVIPLGPPSVPGGPPLLGFNPAIANPTTVKSFDGTAFANSGIMTAGDSFSVTFSKQGTYQYLCLIHPGMEGTVTVLRSGVHVPDQGQRDFEAQAQLDSDLAKGATALAATSAPAKKTNANGSSTYSIVTAPSSGQADVFKFVPSATSIAVGDTVVWDNETEVPHTVSFNSGSRSFVAPAVQPDGSVNLVLPPDTLFPSMTGPTFDGTGYVNSGWITTDTTLATGGTTFSLTFTKPGTYTYVCLLHADQGMSGTIVVGNPTSGGTTTGGATTGGGSVTPPNTGNAGLAAPHAAGTPYTLMGFGLLGLALFLGAGAFGLRLRGHRA